MKVLVCGGRYYNDATTLCRVLDRIHAETPITMVINGGAPGADRFSSLWAMEVLHGWREGRPPRPKLRTFPADWKTHGRAAGPIRNQRMLEEGQPDLVVAFPGGRGTANMVGLARNAGVRVIEIDGEGNPR